MRIAPAWPLLLLLLSCAPTTQYLAYDVPTDPTARPTEGMARVAVGRHFGVLGCPVWFDVNDAGNRIGLLGPGGWVCYDRPPGHVDFHYGSGIVASDESRGSFTVAEGDTLFLTVGLGGSEIEVVDWEEGWEQFDAAERPNRRAPLPSDMNG